MSIRVKAFSSSNRYSANALANSVLPTPVVPKNKKVPIGFFTSCNPARLLRTASLIASIASSWPTTLRCNSSSNFKSFSLSPCSIFITGTPVHLATTSAISSRVTSSFIKEVPAWFSCNCFNKTSKRSCASFIFP